MKGMEDGIPKVYWRFRTVWTVVHVLLVVAGTGALTWWGLTGGNAARLWAESWEGLFGFQQEVVSIVPWPWDG